MCNRDGSMKMMSFKADENNPAFFFLMVIWKHVMAIDGKSTSFFSSHSDVIWVQFLRLADICPPCKNSCQLRIQLNRKYSKKHVVKMLFINSCEIPCLIAFLQLSQVWSKYLSANGLSKHCSNFSNLAKSYGLSGVVQTHPPNNEAKDEKRCEKINLKLNLIMFLVKSGIGLFWKESGCFMTWKMQCKVASSIAPCFCRWCRPCRATMPPFWHMDPLELERPTPWEVLKHYWWRHTVTQWTMKIT